MALDSLGRLYLADSRNNRIRRVDLEHRVVANATTTPVTYSCVPWITTFAGIGDYGFSLGCVRGLLVGS